MSFIKKNQKKEYPMYKYNETDIGIDSPLGKIMFFYDDNPIAYDVYDVSGYAYIFSSIAYQVTVSIIPDGKPHKITCVVPGSQVCENEDDELGQEFRNVKNDSLFIKLDGGQYRDTDEEVDYATGQGILNITRQRNIQRPGISIAKREMMKS